MASRGSCYRVPGETVDRLTQCPICLGRFDDPRMLPCSHTLCRDCIQGLITCGIEDDGDDDLEHIYDDIARVNDEDKKLQCPTCRSRFPIPSGGVSSFPTNPYIADLFEGELVPPKCTEHSNYTMDMYCKTCEVLLCARCCLFDHKTHSFDELSNHAEELRKRFVDLANDGKTYKEGLQKTLDGLRQTEKDIDTESDKALEFVHQKVDAIRKVFKAWEKELIGSITSHEKDSREQIQKSIDLIQKRLNNIDKLHGSSYKVRQAPGVSKIEDDLKKIEESPLQAVDTFGTFERSPISDQVLMEDLVGRVVVSTQNVNPEKEMHIDQSCQDNPITALLFKAGFIWVVHKKTPRLWRYCSSSCNLSGKYAIPVLEDPSGMTVADSESDEKNFVISCFAGEKLHFVYLYNRNKVIDWDIVNLDFAPGHITRHKSDQYLVVDCTNNAVAVLDSHGQVLERIVSPASPSTPNLFTSLKAAVPVADDRYVLLADSQVILTDKNHVIRKSVLGPPGKPSHMVQDNEGCLIIADTSSSRVRYVDIEGKQRASLQIPNPTALYLDKETQLLYVGHGEPGSLKLSVVTKEAALWAVDARTLSVNARTLSVNMMTFV